jgi:hypothetical protein
MKKIVILACLFLIVATVANAQQNKEYCNEDFDYCFNLPTGFTINYIFKEYDPSTVDPNDPGKEPQEKQYKGNLIVKDGDKAALGITIIRKTPYKRVIVKNYATQPFIRYEVENIQFGKVVIDGRERLEDTLTMEEELAWSVGVINKKGTDETLRLMHKNKKEKSIDGKRMIEVTDAITCDEHGADGLPIALINADKWYIRIEGYSQYEDLYEIVKNSLKIKGGE